MSSGDSSPMNRQKNHLMTAASLDSFSKSDMRQMRPKLVAPISSKPKTQQEQPEKSNHKMKNLNGVTFADNQGLSPNFARTANLSALQNALETVVTHQKQ